MKPTDEQAAIVTASRTGANLVIEAGAGTGKTSTLKLLARGKRNDAGVYLAYNKAIADDASRSFPTSVVCKTAHALAFVGVGQDYAHRLNAPRLPAKETARQLGVNAPVSLGSDVPRLSPQQVARIAMATVSRFCYSADPIPDRHHLPRVTRFEAPAARAALADVIVPLARRAWEDLTYQRGNLRFTHDTYLKIWQLSEPNLRADYVLLDEAQDSNPVVTAIVNGQSRSQVILVGDRNQAIYGWRGAVDAMSTFDGERFLLSQSFRFGPEIAAVANQWLTALGAELRLRGHDPIDSRVERVPAPDAILCRSNGGALGAVVDALEAGRKVALVGGGDDLRRYAEAAQRLMRGQPCDHPELLAFNSWWEVRDYVREDSAGKELQVIVKLIDQFTPAGLIKILSGLADETDADLVVSTAHKSKGLEWDAVRIADDFGEPAPNPETGLIELDPGEGMLAYVALTRAKLRLDRGSLSWIDALQGLIQPAAQHRPRPTQPAARPSLLLDADGWPITAAPATRPLHPGTCHGICTPQLPNRCLWQPPAAAPTVLIGAPA